MSLRKVIALLLLAGASGAWTGCERETGPVGLADLTAGETVYFHRVLEIERAKTLALVDRDRGEAVLDSLAAAWGDSARAEVAAGLTGNPFRAEAVHRLLMRVLEAEHDSLRLHPAGGRLGRPAPDPDLAAPAAPDTTRPQRSRLGG